MSAKRYNRKGERNMARRLKISPAADKRHFCKWHIGFSSFYLQCSTGRRHSTVLFTRRWGLELPTGTRLCGSDAVIKRLHRASLSLTRILRSFFHRSSFIVNVTHASCLMPGQRSCPAPNVTLWFVNTQWVFIYSFIFSSPPFSRRRSHVSVRYRCWIMCVMYLATGNAVVYIKKKPFAMQQDIP